MPKKEDTSANVVMLKPGQSFQMEGWDKPQAVDGFGEAYIPRADYTKSRQKEKEAFNAQRAAFDQERQRTEAMLQQRAQEVAHQQHMVMQSSAMNRGPQPVDPWNASVQKAQAQYGGYAPVDLVSQLSDMVNQRSQGFASEMQKRDQQIQFLAQQLQNMNTSVQGLSSHTASTQENAFLQQMRDKYAGELPGSFVDSMWSSLEFSPDENYQESFEQYVDNQVGSLNDFRKEAREKAARDQQRDLRMPGMGGEASPSGGINESVEDMSGEDIAEMHADMAGVGVA